MNDIRHIASGPGYYFASWRDVYVMDFRSTPTLEALDASVIGKKVVHKQNPNGVLVLNIVEGEAPLPNMQIRSYAEKKQNEDLTGVICHGTVVLGESFRSSTVRSMLAGMYLIGRSKYPRKVFSTLDEGSRWIGTFSRGGPAFADSLLLALHTMRKTQSIPAAVQRV